MRRTWAAAGALILAAACAQAAGATVHLQTLVREGDPAPGGGTFTGFGEVREAHAGAIAFNATVSGGGGWDLFRYTPSLGVVKLKANTGNGLFALSDDGSVATGDPTGTCYWLWSPGATSPQTDGCPADRRTLVAGSLVYAFAAGRFYFVGRYDPSPPAHGDNDPQTEYGLGLFTTPHTLVAPMSYPNGWEGSYTAGIDPQWPPGVIPIVVMGGGDEVYVQTFSGNALDRLTGGSLAPVLGEGSPHPFQPDQFLGIPAISSDSVVYNLGATLYRLRDGAVENLTAKYGAGLSNGEASATILMDVPDGSTPRLVAPDPDGLRTVVGVGTKTDTGASIAGIERWATPVVADGSLALTAAVRDDSGAVKSVLLRATDSCFITPPAVPPFALDARERQDANDARDAQRARYVAQLQAALKALNADSARHPSHAARNAKAAKQIVALLRGHAARSLLARARTADAKQDVVDNAKCSWLDEASKIMKEEAGAGTHTKQIDELGDRLLDLKKVLTGEVKAGSPEARKLLETNIAALAEKATGEPNAGVLTGKALRLYGVLSGSVAQKDLPKEWRTQVADLAKVLGGKDYGELASRIVTLVDVLRGDVDADKQFEVLKDTIGALATRIGVDGLLQTPQARALLLGFNLGRAFGERIAEDLKLIANTQLKQACLISLAEAQHLGHSTGEIDFDKPTAAFVTLAGSTFGGWQCKTVSGSVLPDYPNHALVEAYKPPKTYFGVYTIKEQTVYFDPAF